MKRVYCKNCTFHRYPSDSYGNDRCKTEYTITHSYISKSKEYSNPEVRNAHNDCKRYKRSWWKFWIKKK